jgi:hypothetical protein
MVAPKIANAFLVMSVIPDSCFCCVWYHCSANPEILMSKLEFTRKQHYSRKSSLINAGYRKIERQIFCYIIVCAHGLIGMTVQNYWKLSSRHAFSNWYSLKAKMGESEISLELVCYVSGFISFATVAIKDLIKVS